MRITSILLSEYYLMVQALVWPLRKYNSRPPQGSNHIPLQVALASKYLTNGSQCG
ncbi:hypothetical protein AXFE_12550 [Acidithrix ferrooxidans]|uniref:Uncharacterized protein n=1 Tax=Acidithrix ferrooxidans TaxID=1280514 RepID=A0A0D8HIV1_9ACTN|nr:hypothetical protein AXFE_12550 [Acidithrix ferrooxidans]